MRAAAALLLLALSASAQLPEDLRDAVSDLAPPAPAGGGWTKAGSSLLLYDPQGRLADEVGLGRWKDKAAERRVDGGVSADGRFAWRWESASAPQPRRLLTYLDAAGAPLWENPTADAPPGLAPAAQSDDGRTVLVVERDAEGWAVAAVDERGRRLLAVRAGGRVEALRITKNGRFGLVLHRGGPEEAPAYSFLDLKARSYKEFPAHTLPPGPVTLGEDGLVKAGPKTFLRLP